MKRNCLQAAGISGMKGFLPPLLLAQTFRKICQQWRCKFTFHVVPCQSWTKCLLSITSKKSRVFLQLWTIHPSKRCVWADGLLDKTRKQKRNWGGGKEKFCHSFSTWWLSSALNMHVTLCMVLGTNINSFFVTWCSKLCLCLLLLLPTVKLYHSCVKTSSNLKIGHGAAKNYSFWCCHFNTIDGKIQLMHFWCKYHFCQIGKNSRNFCTNDWNSCHALMQH